MSDPLVTAGLRNWALTKADQEAEGAYARLVERAGREMAHREAQPVDHSRCRRTKSVAKLWAYCQPCAIARIRWMAAQPELTHIGTHGRRLAGIYGVEVE